MKKIFRLKNIENKMETKIIDRSPKEITEVAKIAKFFGFKPFVSPDIEKIDFDNTKNLNPDFYFAEKAALLRVYFDEKLISQSQPNMFFCEKPFHGGNERKKPNRLECALVTMGSNKSVCECLSIQTAVSILNSMGYKNLHLEINSIGDKDSVNEFQKKLNLFIRKNVNIFSPELRQNIKKNILNIFDAEKSEWEKIGNECPKSIDFLSEISRAHFKDLLEFLEIMGYSYEINNKLMNDLDVGSEMIFSIKQDGEELARGFRYNRLAKKIGYKKEVPSVFLNISAKLKKNLKKIKNKPITPKFYLVQFGPEAKLKSFLILQELFKVNAEVVHSLAKDKLGSQMGIAENSAAPYILLIGQKEAFENSVVVRNTTTRAQHIISIPEFHSQIKNFK